MANTGLKPISKFICRQELPFLPNKINWFPGHMYKARKTINDEIKKIDIFLEIRDARMPFTSQNANLLELIPKNRKHLVIFNKFDLCNQGRTNKYIKMLQEEQNLGTLILSAKKKMNVEKLEGFIKREVNPKFKTVGSHIMIGGLPNVGKSTIINALRLQAKEALQGQTKKLLAARAGALPCVTRGVSGFKISVEPLIYILDTPGVMMPKIESDEDGLKLALCGCIREGIIEQEILCDYLLYVLNKHKQMDYVEFYKLANGPTNDLREFLDAIKKKYGQIDYNNVYSAVLKDFREGKLGRVTLDIV